MMEHTYYIVELLGDLEGTHIFNTLSAALEFIRENVSPDPEDDRILVWEVLVSEHKKVVWHFSGWHWDSDEFGLPQGALPGDGESLYGKIMREDGRAMENDEERNG